MIKKHPIASTVILLILAALICIFPLMTVKNSEFGGADGAAGELALEINKDYEPWFDNLWTPPGGETESLLFALQAAMGSGVLFGGLGYFLGTRKRDDAKEQRAKK